MARIVKSYDERKTEIINKAWELFSTKGFDKTSVQMIIDALKISKGAFYHYFASKEDLLDAVVSRMQDESEKEIRKILDEDIPADDKFNMFLERSRNWRVTNIDIMREVLQVMIKDENAIIKQKIVKGTTERIKPILGEIIKQGIKESIFNIANPDEAAEFILIIGSYVSERLTAMHLSDWDEDRKVEEIKKFNDFYITSIERIIGAKGGLIKRADTGFIRNITKRINNKGE